MLKAEQIALTYKKEALTSQELWEGGGLEKDFLILYVKKDKQKVKLYLEKLDKSGAEGRIYLIPGYDRVAKIFHKREIAERKREKIEAMIKFLIEKEKKEKKIFDFLIERVTLPRGRLYTRDDAFCGYIMVKLEIDNCITLGEFIRGKYRSYTTPKVRLIKLAVIEKLVKNVAFLNQLGIVVGDINYDNVFICNDKSGIKVINLDADSFQFEWGGKIYPLDGIHPDLVPPEVLRGEGISKKTDSFVLGILIYRILMEGFSPFQFILETDEEITIEEKKLKGLNVFTAGKPPKGLPPLSYLGNLRDIIERSLSPHPEERPSTYEILREIQKIQV